VILGVTDRTFVDDFSAGLKAGGDEITWEPAGKRPAMPGRNKIADHWKAAGFQPKAGWDRPLELCWACGLEDKTANNLTRCHLVPHAIGGPSTCENLMLLCHYCHMKAPSVRDPSYFLRYVKAGGADSELWNETILCASQLMEQMCEEYIKAGGTISEIGKKIGRILAKDVGLAPAFAGGTCWASNLPYVYTRLRPEMGWADD
jgi:5-methylcytosine-specific restriction endonuclease McrA